MDGRLLIFVDNVSSCLCSVRLNSDDVVRSSIPYTSQGRHRSVYVTLPKNASCRTANRHTFLRTADELTCSFRTGFPHTRFRKLGYIRCYRYRLLGAAPVSRILPANSHKGHHSLTVSEGRLLRILGSLMQPRCYCHPVSHCTRNFCASVFPRALFETPAPQQFRQAAYQTPDASLLDLHHRLAVSNHYSRDCHFGSLYQEGRPSRAVSSQMPKGHIPRLPMP